MGNNKEYTMWIHTKDKTKYKTSNEMIKDLKLIQKKINYLDISPDNFEIVIEDENDEQWFAKTYDQKLSSLKLSITQLKDVEILWKGILINYYHTSQLEDF